MLFLDLLKLFFFDVKMAPFQIQNLDHVVIRVRDQDLMTRFYCEVLGCSIERSIDDVGMKQLRAGTSLIDLVSIPRSSEAENLGDLDFKGNNMDHFCIRIEPFDEKVLLDHLRDHGITLGRVEKRYGAEGMGPSIYFSDPEGNRIELKGPPQKIDSGNIFFTK